MAGYSLRPKIYEYHVRGLLKPFLLGPMTDSVPFPHAPPNDSAGIHLEVDPCALGEGLPGADQLIQAGRQLLNQHFAGDMAGAGSVKGRITRASDHPAAYELLAIILSATTYSAVTRRIHFALEHGICTLLSFE